MCNLLSGISANAMSATPARIITVNASLRNTEASDPRGKNGDVGATEGRRSSNPPLPDRNGI
jgi:hypothetical protein